jgi:hypothetical protein
MAMTGRPCAAALAFGAAVVLLTACGGDDPAADRAAEPQPTNSATAPGTTGAADFCDRAAGIDERVDAALSDLDNDVPSVPEAFTQLAVELRGIDPPEAISADWAAMSAGLDRMAQAFADVDITDLDSVQALDAAEGDLSSASDHVTDYLKDECGIDP